MAAIAPEHQTEFWNHARKLEGLDRSSLLSGYADLAGSGQALGSAPLVIMTAERDEKDFEMRRDMHAKLTRLSDNSVHLVARNSGHAIPIERPDLVVAAVQAVTRAAKTKEKLLPAQIQGAEPAIAR